MKTYKTIAFSFILFTCSPTFAHAEPLPELSQYFETQLSGTVDAVNSVDPASSGVDSEWFLRRFWLRIRPRVSFAIPGIAKVEIVPETELLFQKELPTGWTGYKPSP